MLCFAGLGRLAPLPLIPLVTVAAMAGCGASESITPGRRAGTISVRAGFYPLQWMAEQIGGDEVDVTSLTEPGAEPHDLELTPTDVAELADADVVLYLEGFQPAVDEAVGQTVETEAFDVSDAADLETVEGSLDPHFWLDPTRLAAVGEALAIRLGDIRTDKANLFADNAKKLAASLTELDSQFEAGLATCQNRNLVTSHSAFGYLARRYGFEQVGISGLTPEGEPSPGDLASITAFVKQNDVTTIYFETLVSPGIAETVAAETGAETEVLDPIEGLKDTSQGDDYLEVMQANLASLVKGQRCQ